MRCYFMLGTHIVEAVTIDAPNDWDAIMLSHTLFRERQRQPIDGFELWDGNRLIHTHLHDRIAS